MRIDKLDSIEDVIKYTKLLDKDFARVKSIEEMNEIMIIKNPAPSSALSSILNNLNKRTFSAKQKFIEECSNGK